MSCLPYFVYSNNRVTGKYPNTREECLPVQNNPVQIPPPPMHHTTYPPPPPMHPTTESGQQQIIGIRQIICRHQIRTHKYWDHASSDLPMQCNRHDTIYRRVFVCRPKSIRDPPPNYHATEPAAHQLCCQTYFGHAKLKLRHIKTPGTRSYILLCQ